MTVTPCLSVVIPAFNEALRLPRYLDEVVSFLHTRGEPWEVIVVDDGSTDGTAAVVDQVAERYPAVRLLPLSRNRGKGAAVRAGMLAARGALRLFTDADGATPIAELKRLEAALGTDGITIGSRALPAPGVVVRARRHRVTAGRIFAWLVNRLGLSGIADSQCGFKLFSAAAAESLFGRLETSSLAFDVEVLLRARKAGWRVVEVAVNWTDQAGGTVSVLTSGPGMLAEIVQTWWRVGRR